MHPLELLLCLAGAALSTGAAPGLGQGVSPLPPGTGPVDCVVCHGEQGKLMERSVHSRAGIACTDCHGGASEDASYDDPHGDDLVSLTDPAQAVATCGGCHSDLDEMRLYGLRTDQLALYWTSGHGQKLASGDGEDVATCVTCHNAHEVFHSADPRAPVHRRNQVETCSRCHGDAAIMEPYDLSAEGPEIYRDSVHGRALIEGSVSSPACADCHGSHGALPPGVHETGQVCGACHSVVRDYFERGAHMAPAAAGTMQECVSCHSSHDVGSAGPEMFVGTGAGHCASCHDGADEIDGSAVALGRELHDGLMRLDRMITETENEVREAAARGLFIESEDGYLDDARGLRARARALTHELSVEALQDLENRCAGMIGQVREGMAVKYRSLRDRKIFTAIFLLVVAMLAGVLMVFRREIAGRWEKRAELPPPGTTGGSPTADGKVRDA